MSFKLLNELRFGQQNEYGGLTGLALLNHLRGFDQEEEEEDKQQQELQESFRLREEAEQGRMQREAARSTPSPFKRGMEEANLMMKHPGYGQIRSGIEPKQSGLEPLPGPLPSGFDMSPHGPFQEPKPEPVKPPTPTMTTSKPIPQSPLPKIDMPPHGPFQQNPLQEPMPQPPRANAVMDRQPPIPRADATMDKQPLINIPEYSKGFPIANVASGVPGFFEGLLSAGKGLVKGATLAATRGVPPVMGPAASEMLMKNRQEGSADAQQEAVNAFFNDPKMFMNVAQEGLGKAKAWLRGKGIKDSFGANLLNALVDAGSTVAQLMLTKGLGKANLVTHAIGQTMDSLTGSEEGIETLTQLGVAGIGAYVLQNGMKLIHNAFIGNLAKRGGTAAIFGGHDVAQKIALNTLTDRENVPLVDEETGISALVGALLPPGRKKYGGDYERRRRPSKLPPYGEITFEPPAPELRPGPMSPPPRAGKSTFIPINQQPQPTRGPRPIKGRSFQEGQTEQAKTYLMESDARRQGLRDMLRMTPVIPSEPVPPMSFEPRPPAMPPSNEPVPGYEFPSKKKEPVKKKLTEHPVLADEQVPRVTPTIREWMDSSEKDTTREETIKIVYDDIKKKKPEKKIYAVVENHPVLKNLQTQRITAYVEKDIENGQWTGNWQVGVTNYKQGTKAAKQRLARQGTAKVIMRDKDVHFLASANTKFKKDIKRKKGAKEAIEKYNAERELFQEELNKNLDFFKDEYELKEFEDTARAIQNRMTSGSINFPIEEALAKLKLPKDIDMEAALDIFKGRVAERKSIVERKDLIESDIERLTKAEDYSGKAPGEFPKEITPEPVKPPKKPTKAVQQRADEKKARDVGVKIENVKREIETDVERLGREIKTKSEEIDNILGKSKLTKEFTKVSDIPESLREQVDDYPKANKEITKLRLELDVAEGASGPKIEKDTNKLEALIENEKEIRLKELGYKSGSIEDVPMEKLDSVFKDPVYKKLTDEEVELQGAAKEAVTPKTSEDIFFSGAEVIPGEASKEYVDDDTLEDDHMDLDMGSSGDDAGSDLAGNINYSLSAKKKTTIGGKETTKGKESSRKRREAQSPSDKELLKVKQPKTIYKEKPTKDETRIQKITNKIIKGAFSKDGTIGKILKGIETKKEGKINIQTMQGKKKRFLAEVTSILVPPRSQLGFTFTRKITRKDEQAARKLYRSIYKRLDLSSRPGSKRGGPRGVDDGLLFAHAIEYPNSRRAGAYLRANPDMKSYVDEFRKIYLKVRDALRDRKLLSSFLVDYYNHSFEGRTDPGSHGKTFKSTGMLKTREKTRNMSMLEAYEEFGLMPLHKNPVDQILSYVTSAAKTIFFHDFVEQAMESGNAEFAVQHENHIYLKEGFSKLKSTREMERYRHIIENHMEVLDLNQRKALMEVAKNLGVKVKTVLKGKGIGSYNRDKKLIRIKSGARGHNFAEEIGHAISHAFNLKKFKEGNDKYGAELKELIKFKQEGLLDPVSPGYLKHINKTEEQMALLTTMYVQHRSKFEQAAPNVFKFFDTFVRTNPKLKPLIHAQPSLVDVEHARLVKHPTPVKVGEIVFKTPFAKLLDKQLGLGFRDSERKTTRFIYKGLSAISDTMTAFELSFSAFHAGFITMDAVQSSLALAMRYGPANPKQMLQSLGRFGRDLLIIPNIRNAIKTGKQIKELFFGRAMLLGGNLIDPQTQVKLNMELKDAIDKNFKMKFSKLHKRLITANALEIANGNWGPDASSFRNHKAAIAKAFRNSGLISPGVAKHTLPMLLETAMAPILEWYVPMQKLSVFDGEVEMLTHKKIKYGWSMKRYREEIRLSWRSIDYRMGQVVYENMHLEKKLKDFLVWYFRAFGWGVGAFGETLGGVYDIFAQTIPAVGMNIKKQYLKLKTIADKRRLTREEMLRVRKLENKLREYQEAYAKVKGDKRGQKMLTGHVPGTKLKWAGKKPYQPYEPSMQLTSARTDYTLSMGLLVGGLGAAIYILVTGEKPKTLMDTVALPIGTMQKDGTRKKVMLQTYMGEGLKIFKGFPNLGEMIGSTVETLKHKVNPLISFFMEAIVKNEDWRGFEIHDTSHPLNLDSFKEIMENFVSRFKPFSFQNMAKQKGLLQKGMSLIGMVSPPSRVTKSRMNTERDRIYREYISPKKKAYSAKHVDKIKTEAKELWEDGVGEQDVIRLVTGELEAGRITLYDVRSIYKSIEYMGSSWNDYVLPKIIERFPKYADKLVGLMTEEEKQMEEYQKLLEWHVKYKKNKR